MERNTLEPKIEDRKKFDLDLKYGKATEEQKSALKTIMADYKQAKKKFRKENKK